MLSHTVNRRSSLAAAAAARAVAALDFPFTLTARAENLLRGVDDLEDTIARLQAYRDAGDTLMGIPEDITRDTLDVWEKDRKSRPKGVGPTILSKLKEFADTGGLAALRKEYARPQLELTKVSKYGTPIAASSVLVCRSRPSIRDHPYIELRREPILAATRLHVRFSGSPSWLGC